MTIERMKEVLEESKLHDRFKYLQKRNEELYAEIDSNLKEMCAITDKLYEECKPDMSLVEEIHYYEDKNAYEEEWNYIEYSYKGVSIWWNCYQEGEYTINWGKDDYWYSSLEDACKAIENH